ncbi:nucleotidyltransferase [candidate division WOR-3 bacterium]|uniref:Nucleotidyltransferase n=1 Tax=candidate division WOR-3 bacterium TaxID=2052148 RepID=A0A937XIX6_UNCW3|nr:nucleotidyltransferase [candidate division WOR-3 bacterium]
MATTVDEGFRNFLPRLTPTATESDAAKKHRTSISECLKSNFGMTRFFRTGSFGNGTSIRGYSDVDYFAEIPRDKLTQVSTNALQKVRLALDTRFPDTGVAVRTPAVVVPFGTDASETTEVVPADYIRDEQGHALYDMPDFGGGWMRASPDAQLAYVVYWDDKLDRKVRPLVRFLKAWRCFRDVPISSFYLEMRTAKYAATQESIYYPIDVKVLLKQLWDCQLAAAQDPTVVGGYIHACSTEAMTKDALSKLETALVRAEKARDAEKEGKTEDAFYWWRLLYNYEFPAYG